MDIHSVTTMVPWQESWDKTFAAEQQQIIDAMNSANLKGTVSHVGSTSIRGMISKPIIDILVCPETDMPVESFLPVLEKIGYFNLGECGRPGRYFLSKGDIPNQAFYLHLCHKGHPVARDQLLFQRLERENQRIFQSYYELKVMLADAFSDDRNMYRMVKGCYIDGVLSAYRQQLPKGNDPVKYWVLEFDLLPETEAALRENARNNEMTIDEYFESEIRNMIDHPEWIEEIKQYYLDHPEESGDITLVRAYPVLRSETEAQARKRKIGEEMEKS